MLENTNVKEQFTIADSATFDFGVRFFSPNDISCYEYNPNTKIETRLSSGTDYSIEEKTDYSSGAKVTLLGPLTSGNILTIVRTVLPQQKVSLPNFGKIPSESLATQLDRTVAVQQQLVDKINMMYQAPYGAGVDPAQAIKDLVGSGGGGGSGGTADYASRAGIADVASGLVSGAVVESANHAGNAEYADDAGFALSAGITYRGPFAPVVWSSDVPPPASTISMTILDTSQDNRYVAGRVVVGKSSYTVAVSAFLVSYGGAVNLVGVSSTGGSPTFVMTTSNPPIGNGAFLTRLVAVDSGGTMTQIQHGDVVIPEWGKGEPPDSVGFASSASKLTSDGETALLAKVTHPKATESSAGAVLISSSVQNETVGSDVVVPTVNAMIQYVSDHGGGGGTAAYNGPFAVTTSGTKIIVNGGRMYLAGSETSEAGTSMTSSNGNVYYYLYYSGGSYISGYTVASSPAQFSGGLSAAVYSSQGVYFALANVSNGAVVQYHYGDIHVDGRWT